MDCRSSGQAAFPSDDSDFPADDLAALTAAIADRLSGLWPSTSKAFRRFEELRQRLHEERLNLAVLGQFKRGKSTVINALLGEALLPTGIIPLTAIPTFIAWARDPLVRVSFHAAAETEIYRPQSAQEIRDRLFQFVTEEANPNNRLNVVRVELFYPAEILNRGVVFIDTPGIGSTYRHNTDTALEALHDCDAALFVVSADPPITEAEIQYLEVIRAKVAHIIFILNKTDYLSSNERQVAVDFLRKTVGGTNPDNDNPPVFCLSALSGLEAKQSHDAAVLEESGLNDIEAHLANYLDRDGTASLQAAAVKKTLGVLDDAIAETTLRIRALEIPLADLERRIATFDKALVRIDTEKKVIHDRLAGDRRRTVEELEAQADRLRHDAENYFQDILNRALAKTDKPASLRHAQETIADTVPEFFRNELKDIAASFAAKVDGTLREHQDRVDDLVNLVRQTATDIFEIPLAETDDAEIFQIGSRPYWVTQKWDVALNDVANAMVDWLLPPRLRIARRKMRLLVEIKRIVRRNVENLRWATLQGVDDTFRRFGSFLDDKLEVAIDATQGAAKAAAEKRLTTSDGVEGEIGMLRRLANDFAKARSVLCQA